MPPKAGAADIFGVKLIAPQPDTRIAIDHDYTVKPLLTATEARFHACLDLLTHGRCRIQVKPRLADIFDHEKGDLRGFNKISQKHVDFLICRNDDWAPMMGIELDDHTHETKRVKERDMFVNALFASTGVPLLRIHVSEIDQLEQLVHKLNKAWDHRRQTLPASLRPTNCIDGTFL